MARTSTIILLTGDYAERLDALYAEAVKADEASGRGNRRTADKRRYEKLRADFEELKAEAEESGIKVVIQALDRRKSKELKKKYPPRTDGDPVELKADRSLSLNVEAAEEDLVAWSVVYPEFASREAFDEWAWSLSEADYRAVANRAWDVYTTVRTDPKSLPPLPTPSSDAT